MAPTRSLLPKPKFRCQMFPPTFRARQKSFVAYRRFLRGTPQTQNPLSLANPQKRENGRHPFIIAETQIPSTLVSTNFLGRIKVVCSPPAISERNPPNPTLTGPTSKSISPVHFCFFSTTDHSYALASPQWSFMRKLGHREHKSRKCQ